MMVNAMVSNKRLRERLLCDDRFSHAEVQWAGQCLCLQSINYNATGIGLFSADRLPEGTQGSLCFSYAAETGLLLVEQLPAQLIYAHETEVGHQYGFRFELERASIQALGVLRQIEQALQSACRTDRYGLFD